MEGYGSNTYNKLYKLIVGTFRGEGGGGGYYGGMGKKKAIG